MSERFHDLSGSKLLKLLGATRNRPCTKVMCQVDYLLGAQFPCGSLESTPYSLGVWQGSVSSVSSNSKPGIHIAWKTVTYRSVMLGVLAIILVLFAGMRFAFPQFTESTIKAADGLSSKMLEAVAGVAGNPAKSGSAGAQQAHFTALDGTVRVKKANGNSWGTADYSIPLEKGDVVQTSSEGMAKIVFNDGTNYTVKQDSLIVIEENSTNDQQQTQVAVAVSTGTVDLATATYVQGSRSEVTVAGATASLAPDSAAMVRNDPKGDQHEILVKKGTGDITRNGETVRLADWEKVSFQAAGPAHGQVERNRSSDSDLARQHDADVYVGRSETDRIFVDTHGECERVTGCESLAILIFRPPS